MKRFVAILLAAVGAVLLLCGLTAAQSRIYLADEADHELYWTLTNGTNETVFTETTPVSLEVDQEDGWMYWLTANYGHGQYGQLHRARLHDPSQHQVIVESGYTEGGLELDRKTGYVYWAAPALAPPPAPDFSIVRSATDGSDWEVWLPGVSNRVRAMDLDPNARLLFWTAGNALMRAHLDTKVVGPVSLDWGAMLQHPFQGGVAVDSTYRKVYWAEGGTPYGPLNGETSRIFRTQYSGGPVTLVYEGYEAKVTDLVFDPVTRTLYWLERFLENNVEKLAIKKAPVGNQLPLTAVEVMRPARQPRDLALFADPGAAALTFPADQATVETTVRLNWMPVLGSFRYDVQVATDPLFRSILYTENTPTTHAEFVAPVAEHTYYWRVQSNACYIAPHWSQTRTLNVGDTGALAVRLVYPEDGGTVELTEVFTWDPAPLAATYTIQVSPHDYFGDVLVHGTDLTETSFEVTGLERGETYFWRVAGYDDQGRYTFSLPQTFKVATLLTAVSLSQPSDGSSEVDPHTVFEWMTLEGASAYEVEFSADPNFASAQRVTTESTSYTVETPFGYEEAVYWRVRGVNQFGPGEWSATWLFTTAAAQTLAAVTLSEPSNESEGVPAYTEFSWAPLDGAESYELEVAADADFTNVLHSVALDETSYTVDVPFAYETTFYWRVRGVDQVGPGAWSEVWHFTTAVGTGIEDVTDVPTRTELLQPYPNPASTMVEIPFALAKPTNVTFSIYSVDGRLVASRVLGRMGTGRFVERLDTSDLHAGTYVIVMNGQASARKMLVLVN